MDIRVETSRLILRPLTESDVATVRLINGDEHKTDEAALEFIRWQMNPGRLLIQFYIWLRKTNQCIGRVYIHAKPEINNEVEIGYGILEEHRNQGYATEAAKAAVWYAFERAEQEVLAAIVSSENIASRRVIEKLGFISGGTRTVYHDGENREFDYFRLYHTDYLPGPEWDSRNLYKPEPMGAFFDTRADGYNNVMFASSSGEDDYKRLGVCFPKTNEAVQILDIGCGTGIELDYIWEQMPNAHITCVDVSRGMLDLLLKNHPSSHDRITIIEASYIDWTYPENAFDIVVSNMTMHHLWPEEKIEVYRKILSTLKPGGSYIEGDFIVKDDLMAEQYRRRYEIITENLPDKAKAGE
jgi:RimJ/RimL family protein N-acetyltransferase/ubiquinone/menaquinone biosynthesis C-methylase UbiE